jgi:hypothetical protein
VHSFRVREGAVKPTKKPRKQLLLTREKVRDLRPDELDRVAGGECDDTWCSFTSGRPPSRGY